MEMQEKCRGQSKCLRNENFYIEFDENTGYITSIKNPSDEHEMNWCAEDGQWGRIHVRAWNPWFYEFKENDDVKMKLVSFVCESDRSEAVYRNNIIVMAPYIAISFALISELSRPAFILLFIMDSTQYSISPQDKMAVVVSKSLREQHITINMENTGPKICVIIIHKPPCE